MKKGPFKIEKSKSVYTNPWIKIREDEVVRPNGKKGIFGVVEAGEGVSILALDSENQVYLIYEFHYAINKYELILPSGGINSQESPLEAAKRELKEETGIVAEKWTQLGAFNPLTMIIHSPSYYFLAEEFSSIGEVAEEELGLIEVKKMPFTQALDLVEKGEISHSGSVITILKTARLKGI